MKEPPLTDLSGTVNQEVVTGFFFLSSSGIFQVIVSLKIHNYFDKSPWVRVVQAI